MLVGAESEDAYIKAFNRAFQTVLDASEWRDLKSQLLKPFRIVVAGRCDGFPSKSSLRRPRRPRKSRTSCGASSEQRAADSVRHEDAGSYGAYLADTAPNWTRWGSSYSEVPELSARGGGHGYFYSRCQPLLSPVPVASAGVAIVRER